MAVVPVSEMARRISEATGFEVRPTAISGLFYARAIPDDAAPVVAGRRLIPTDLQFLIESKLRAAGKLPPKPEPLTA